MNCEQFRVIVQDVARDEMQNSAEVEHALTHADGCGDCDALLDAAESVSIALRTLANRHATDAAPERVENTLLQAFTTKFAKQSERAFNRADGSVRNAPARFPWPWSAAGVGVAAVALLTLSLTWHTGPAAHSQNGSVTSLTASVSGRTGELVASLRANDDANVADPTDGSSASEAGWASPFATPTAAADAEAQPFVPLSDTFDPASVDDDTMVRVVMPRETLQGLGLPLAADPNGQVLADIIVTDDGTPQAIRVLGW